MLMALFALSSFSCEEENGDDRVGCVTGIYKHGGTDRVYLYCCTKKQFSDSNACGGSTIIEYYTDFKFEPTSSCLECN
jgi:hypothetical protein